MDLTLLSLSIKVFEFEFSLSLSATLKKHTQTLAHTDTGGVIGRWGTSKH